MKSGNKLNYSLICVNIAVLMYSVAGLLAKVIEANSVIITFGRVVISSAVLLIYGLLTKKDLKLKNARDLIKIAVAGAFLAVHWVTFLGTVQIATVAIASITYSTFPLFAVFIEPLVYKTKITGKNIVLSAIMLTGVIITVPEFSMENSMAKGIAMGLVSAFCYSILSIINKSASESYEPTTVTFYEQLTAAVLLTPAALIMGIDVTPKDAALIAVMGVMVTAFAFSLYVSSLKNLSVQVAGICSAMEIVYCIILAMIFVGEIPSVREVVGGAIVMAVVIYTQISTAKEAAAGENEVSH